MKIVTDYNKDGRLGLDWTFRQIYCPWQCVLPESMLNDLSLAPPSLAKAGGRSVEMSSAFLVLGGGGGGGVLPAPFLANNRSWSEHFDLKDQFQTMPAHCD